MAELNGAVLNIYGLGIVLEDAEVKQVGKNQRARVRLAEFDRYAKAEGSATQVWKRDFLSVDLVLKPGMVIPRKGDTVVVNSGTLSLRPGTEHASVDLVVFSWRIVSAAPVPASSRLEDNGTASHELPPKVDVNKRNSEKPKPAPAPEPDPNEVPAIPGESWDIPV